MLLSLGVCAQNFKTESECMIKINPICNITSSNMKALFTVVYAPEPELVGCLVHCKILKVRKSNLTGAEGRLVIPANVY